MQFLSSLFLACIFFTLSLMLPKASAQEAKEASLSRTVEAEASSQQQQGPTATAAASGVAPSAEVTPPAAAASSSPESPSAPDAVAVTHDEKTNAVTTTSEEPSSGVVPTDPSMIPPPENTPPANGSESLTPLPVDPNAAGSTATGTPDEEGTSPVNNTESVEKKKHELKVRYTEVRTQVEKEEAVAALRLKADQASTDEGKRQALRAYYELLFKRMKQVDASLSQRCELMQGAYLRRLEQEKIEPTIPLHPAPAGDKPQLRLNPTFAIRDSDISQYTRSQNDLSNHLCMRHTPHDLKNHFETKSSQNLIYSNSESRVNNKISQ